MRGAIRRNVMHRIARAAAEQRRAAPIGEHTESLAAARSASSG